jgi:hypothetical protein
MTDNTNNPVVYSFKLKSSLQPFTYLTGSDDAIQIETLITKYWTGKSPLEDLSARAAVQPYVQMALASRQLETQVHVHADGSWSTTTQDTNEMSKKFKTL